MKDAKGHGSNGAHQTGVEDATRTAAYNVAKATGATLEAESKRTSDITRSFPRLPNGLTPDHVRALPEYQAARKASDVAFQNLRNFNGAFVKAFPKEIKADRMAKLAARMK